MKNLQSGCVLIFGFLIAAGIGPARAESMRAFRAIPTPAAVAADKSVSTAREGAIRPVDRETMATAIRDVAAAWSRREMSELLADDFQRKGRFIQSLDLESSRNAELTVDAVRNISTLQQRVEVGPDGKKHRVSVVSAIVNSRVTLNDPNSGYVRAPGENRMVFEVLEPLE